MTFLISIKLSCSWPYIYLCTCTHVHVYVQIYIYICIHALSAYIHVCICTHMNTSINMYICVYLDYTWNIKFCMKDLTIPNYVVLYIGSMPQKNSRNQKSYVSKFSNPMDQLGQVTKSINWVNMLKIHGRPYKLKIHLINENFKSRVYLNLMAFDDWTMAKQSINY